MHPESAPLLEVAGLAVTLPTGRRGEVEAVRHVDLSIRPGERVGIVGESGSGKSVTGRAIAGLLPTSPRVRVTGSIKLHGQELVGAADAAWNVVRQRTVGMVFQDPLTFLNPTMKIGKQVRESIRGDRGLERSERPADEVFDFLRLAGLTDAELVAQRFPHELSGGMRQRVLIAIAIAKLPDLIIADEPTTALDTTVQKKVLRTLDQTVSELGKSLILISHDMAVVAGMTDRLYVMYAGQVVEDGPTHQIIASPRHNYTRALLRSVRSLTERDAELYSVPESLHHELAEEARLAT